MVEHPLTWEAAHHGGIVACCPKASSELQAVAGLVFIAVLLTAKEVMGYNSHNPHGTSKYLQI